MRQLFAAGLLASVLSLAVPAVAGTRTVKVGDDYFVRSGGATVKVSKGTTVKWAWNGSHPHNVVAKSGPVKFRSPVGGGTGFAFKKKMTRAGTYKIICEIHGAAAMHMTLKVT